MKFYSLNQLPLYTDDFFFRHLDRIQAKDAIVIFNPSDAVAVSPVLLHSRKSLEEHIEHICRNNIKKAIVVAEDIGFLRRCPCLEYIWIVPAISAENFDYSPIYDLPNLKWLQCETLYGLKAMYDVNEKVKIACLDYSRFHSLKRLSVSGDKGNLNVKNAGNIVSLFFNSGFPNSSDLSNYIPGTVLQSFSICESPIQSLDGIEDASKLRRLELSYNRRLTDISALACLKDSLKYLEIDTCGKIQDFSVLSELHNLEFLTLKGSNTLPDLSFLREIPKLRNLHLAMNVADGNLSLCEKIPYVRVKNRSHFSHKDKELPKNYTDPDKVCPFEIS